MSETLRIGLVIVAFAFILFGAFHLELFILDIRAKRLLRKRPKRSKYLSRQEKIDHAIMGEHLPWWASNLIVFAGSVLLGVSQVLSSAFSADTPEWSAQPWRAQPYGVRDYELSSFLGDFLPSVVLALPAVWVACYVISEFIPNIRAAMIKRDKKAKRRAAASSAADPGVIRHTERLAQSAKHSRYKTPGSTEAIKAKAERITKKLRAEVYASESDWDLLFNFPALQDMRVAQTAEFYQLFRKLSEAELMADESRASHASVKEFLQCAQDATKAWKRAASHAREIGLTYLDVQKAQDAAMAIRLLPMIDPDSRASENERQIAYSRLERIARSLGFRPAVREMMLEGAAMRSMITDGNG